MDELALAEEQVAFVAPGQKKPGVEALDDLANPEPGLVLSAGARQKAESILDRRRAAVEKGDDIAIQALVEELLADPELSAAIETKNPTSEAIKLEPVLKAFDDLDQKIGRIVGLCQNAFDRGAVTEGLFNNDQELASVIARVAGLRASLLDAKSYAQAQTALENFSQWYKNSQPIILTRMRAKVEYFGGNLPQELVTQADLFVKLDEDVSNMQTYLNLAIKA